MIFSSQYSSKQPRFNIADKKENTLAKKEKKKLWPSDLMSAEEII